MADERFFRKAGPFSLAKLAETTGASLPEGGDPSQMIADVAPISDAGPDAVTFLENPRYATQLGNCNAGACFISPEAAEKAPPHLTLLVSPRPRRCFALASRLFYPAERSGGKVHPSAIIDPTAKLGQDIEVGPGAVIEARAEIGDRCRVAANAVIGCGVVLGEDSEVGPCASISHALVGCRVVIYPGVRIGQPGFGFDSDHTGHLTIPQLGRVIIGDDVEVGANTTIDRGAGPDTVIGSGTMIDNLVQIGHNVVVGENSVIVAQVGVAGSSRLGRFVVLGGASGVAGHLEIGDGAQVAAMAGVGTSLKAGARVSGIPAIDIREWLSLQRAIRRLGRKAGKGGGGDTK